MTFVNVSFSTPNQTNHRGGEKQGTRWNIVESIVISLILKLAVAVLKKQLTSGNCFSLTKCMNHTTKAG